MADTDRVEDYSFMINAELIPANDLNALIKAVENHVFDEIRLYYMGRETDYALGRSYVIDWIESVIDEDGWKPSWQPSCSVTQFMFYCGKASVQIK